MKQQLSEALAEYNRNFLVHTDYDGSWEFSEDADLIFAAAVWLRGCYRGIVRTLGIR